MPFERAIAPGTRRRHALMLGWVLDRRLMGLAQTHESIDVSPRRTGQWGDRRDRERRLSWLDNTWNRQGMDQAPW